MAVFAIYVIWDVSKTKRYMKLLFLLPVGMSVFMFPPFINWMSEQFFMVYRTILVIVCLLIILIYFVSVRKRQSVAARQPKGKAQGGGRKKK